MSDISKEEVFTLVEVMSKTAGSLEKISMSLETTSETLKEVNSRLHNGITKEIIEQVVKQCEGCSSVASKDRDTIKGMLKEVKDDTSSNRININNMKLFVGAIALLIIIVTSVVTLVLRAVDTRALAKSQTHEMLQELISSGVIKNNQEVHLN